jgi:hypothetical protein
MKHQSEIFVHQLSPDIMDLETQHREEVCVVCSSSDCGSFVGFPVFVYLTHLPLEFDGNVKWNAVAGFCLCPHLVHPECVSSSFFCPLDNGKRNAILPRFERYSPPSMGVVSGLIKFVNEMRKGGNGFYLMMSSISALIVTYEMRLRGSPSCLDNSVCGILAKNLFLCAWHYYRLVDSDLYVEFSDWTVFRRFIYRLIVSPDPNLEFKELVRDSLAQVESDVVLFLRRARLALWFLLEIEDAAPCYGKEFPDWDSLLCCESLAAYFHVDVAAFADSKIVELRPYQLTKLPEEFLDFGREELFNIPVWDLVNPSFLCLHTGEYLPFECDESEYFKKRRGDPTLRLVFGPKASAVSLRVGENEYKIDSIYRDRMGCVDHGLKRDQMVFLSREKYEWLTECLLSGSFVKFM